MIGKRKALIKFNQKKLMSMVKKVFKETTQEYFEECQKVIEDPNAFPQFPNQDIVDTGALKNSGKLVTKSGKYTAEWKVPYAVYVHEGYTLRNGREQSPRPWTELAKKRMDFDKVLGDKLAKVLKEK
jgi:hypothetical protein